MKLTCEIVQDLLPLYADEVCSPGTRRAVEEHLAGCPVCRAQSERTDTLELELHTGDVTGEDSAVVRSLQKVKKRWWRSLAAALMVIPVLWLSVNQFLGRGVCITNVDDILSARRLCQALAKGDFEKAADLQYCDGFYREILDILEWKPEDYRGDYVPVTVSGREYVANKSFVHDNLENRNDDLDFWSAVIYNRIGGCLIPEEIWNTVRERSPDSFAAEDGIYIVNGDIRYFRVENQWGVFYSNDEQLAACDDPVVIVHLLDLIPVELYEAVEHFLISESVEHYRFNQKYYEQAGNMSEDEFEAFVKAEYVANLRMLANKGYTISIGVFTDSYYRTETGEWVIIYDMTLSKGGRSQRFSIDVTVKEDVLSVGAMSYNQYLFPDIDLASILFFGYPGER